MDAVWTYSSPIGELTLAETGGSLTGLWMAGQRYYPAKLPPEKLTPLLLWMTDWLDAYFAGQNPPLSDIPLAPQGSPFRREVWQLLQKIPYGTTVTYAQLAREIAILRGIPKMSAQAVGGAVGHNPIAIAIPCHRVVGTDGSLTGYAGGLERKQWLLTLEQSI